MSYFIVRLKINKTADILYFINESMELDLTGSQMRVLFFLHQQKNFECSQKELEDYLNVSHPTINGILKRMEEKGFLSTEITKKDGHLSKTVKSQKKDRKLSRRQANPKTSTKKNCQKTLPKKNAPPS